MKKLKKRNVSKLQSVQKFAGCWCPTFTCSSSTHAADNQASLNYGHRGSGSEPG